MDYEELQREINKLIDWLGPAGEELFNNAVALERIYWLNQLRTLLLQKEASNDQIAVEVLSWAILALSGE